MFVTCSQVAAQYAPPVPPLLSSHPHLSLLLPLHLPVQVIKMGPIYSLSSEGCVVLFIVVLFGVFSRT